MRIVGVFLITLVSAAAFAQTPTWGKYTRERRRTERATVKEHFYLASHGVFGVAKTAAELKAVWLTEPVARELVSRQVDVARLSDADAEARYQKLADLAATPDRHTLLVGVVPRWQGTAESLGLVNREAIFLQRPSGGAFARGTVIDDSIPGLDASLEVLAVMVLQFPSKDESGRPLVDASQTSLELSLSTKQNKDPTVFAFKLRDALGQH